MTMVMMIKIIMKIIGLSLPLLMLPLHLQADQGVQSLCNFPGNNFQKKISKILYIFWGVGNLFEKCKEFLVTLLRVENPGVAVHSSRLNTYHNDEKS